MFKKEIGELETVIYLLQCRAKTVIITIRLMHTFESCQSLFPMRILELASSSYKLMRLATTLASAFVFLSKDLSRKMLDALPSFSSCLIIAEVFFFFLYRQLCSCISCSARTVSLYIIVVFARRLLS